MRINKNQIAFLFFFISFGIYAITKGQQVSFDFENYHFYNGFAFLNNRLQIDYAAAGIQTYFNPLLDAFNYVLIEHFNDPRLFQFILGGIGGLNGFFLWKIARLLFPGSGQGLKVFLSILIGITGATVLSQIGSVMNDAQSALFVVIALFFMIKGFEAPMHEARYDVLAGLFLGIATAFKLTNSLFFFAAFSAYLVYCIMVKQNLCRLLSFSAACILGFLLLDGWWAWRLYQVFGNPVFPYYNDLFHSVDFINSPVKDVRFIVNSFTETFVLPFKLMNRNQMLVTENLMRDGRLAALFVLTALFILKYIAKCAVKKHIHFSAIWAFVFTFTFVAYFLWALQFGIYRYATPFALLLGPCIIFLIDWLVQNWFTKRIAMWLMTLCLLVTTMRPDFGHMQRYDDQFLKVEVPALPNHALVVIASPGESFLIPFLNPTAQFINANFPSLEQDFIAQKRIRAHTGPSYVLLNNVLNENMSLSEFNALYALRLGGCQAINSNLAPAGSFSLCQLLKD